VFSNIEAVLFDMGGTLVEFPMPCWPVLTARCLRSAAASLVRSPEKLAPPAAALPAPEEARARRTRPAPDTPPSHRFTLALRRVIRSMSGRTLPRLAEAFARPAFAEGYVFDETVRVLTALRDRGYRLGLVSNTPWGTPDYLWESQLDRFSLAPYFQVRLFSSAVGYRKPDVRIFREALARMNVPAERAVFVGDEPRADILGASQAGLRTALVLRSGRRPVQMAAPPDACVQSLAGLLDHLPGPGKKD
jgi:HAD superfamily hydrolase (TIGR01509 family)